MKLKKYKYVKQKDQKDCGPASIATVLKQYNSNVSIAKIREVSGTSDTGTNALGIVKGLEYFNFKVKSIKADMNIFKEKDLPYPAIAHIVKDKLLLHFIVILNVGKKKITIADPSEGVKKLTYEEFEEMWTGVVFFCLPNDNYEMVKDKNEQLEQIFKMIISDKKLITHIILASILVILIGIGTSFYFQTIIDSIIPSGAEKTLHIISIALIVSYIFQSLFEYIKNYMLAVLGNRMSIKVMLGYYRHVMKLPMNFFATRKSGEIVSRFMDASKVIDALGSVVLTSIIDVSMVLIVGAVLYFQNQTLFFVTVLTIPIYALIILSFIKWYEKANKQELQDNAHLNSYIIESLNGIETIKASQADESSVRKVDNLFLVYINSMMRTFNIDNLQTLLKRMIQLVSTGVILWIGATLVLDNELSIGQLITFNSLLVYFTDPLLNIINLQPRLQTAKVAAERLNDVMIIDSEMEENENKKISNDIIFDGDIELKDVSFNYPTRREVLKNINISISSAEKIAIVGKSGSGKSTLAKLLVSFYNTTKGEILFNKYNIEDVDKNYLRKKITLVPQKPFFFSGTIYENLTFGIDRDVNLEEIVEVCKKVQIHEFISSLPLRYNSYLEENGDNFSGGQQQRLALARALLRKSKVIILDEATSNVDQFTEKKIMNEILNDKDLTIIIIAHRLSILTNCDSIYVIKDNIIAENGTHKELIEKGGLYYDMWNI
ncbi:peptide cleavage/export ABC transporter [Oceanobacillus kimchii]|uniref:peptidase domain-containing ABC transporter n=1 Tax=Oceanobacillus kimchii TaxID=746691 RepID=UPI0021A8CDD0|nr:peptide cleavage/export ABC transporter [Oceanobacillus kimchii]MCT1577293.1 peptide cleavage/export ABC transporter [Oceanobacillus kimchii]MCT2136899.1 peptide cleavage/export ABC transporter [Oceanobacillus kimchii]